MPALREDEMIRHATLPTGWYPDSASEMRDSIDRWVRGDGGAPTAHGGAGAGAGGAGTTDEDADTDAAACVAPHAGWGFSGPLAARAIARLGRTARIVVIAGGHLRSRDPILVSTAEGHRTPLGVAATALEAARMVQEQFTSEEISELDNSTDVLIPMVQHLLPDAEVLVCRVPPSGVAEELGEALATYGKERNLSVTIVGSTDLTHYGPGFGFAPHGTGERAHEWVVETNDAGFLDVLIRMDGPGALAHAASNQSACSPGGALVALAYARRRGATRGELVGHYTSYDIRPGSTFVGYGGVVFM